MRLLDKKFMHEMFRKAVELAKKDHDAEEVETLQHGLGVALVVADVVAAMRMYVNLSCADMQRQAPCCLELSHSTLA